ncbi:MAG TPA: hypothetical protein VGQ86_05975 [Candidatus Limnocylindria bacterium]|jgi:uncharacterized protein YceK|nr:hypothetical protein [Candidatus Limnocylindria bacterium]
MRSVIVLLCVGLLLGGCAAAGSGGAGTPAPTVKPAPTAAPSTTARPTGGMPMDDYGY